MMAARALISVLNRDYKVEEKLNILRKIIESNKFKTCAIQEKVIDWLFESIQSSSFKENSNYDLQLWTILHDLLKGVVHGTNKDVVYFKTSFSKVFVEKLRSICNQDPSLKLIFKSLNLFLHLSLINNSVAFDTETLLCLLFANFDAFCKLFINESEVLSEARHVIKTIFDLINCVARTLDETKVPLFVQALKEISSFIYFTANRVEFDSLNERLIHMLNGIIFNPKSCSYKTIFTPDEESDDENVPDTNILSFFSALQKLIKKQKVYNISGCAMASALMKKMMSHVFLQNKSSLEPLSILALFCAVSGFDIPLLISADSCCKNLLQVNFSDASMILLPVSHLLKACEPYPEYFLLSSVEEGYLKPIDWLEGVLARLFDMKNCNDFSVWLQCFQSLLKISVSLVENNISSFVRLCLLDIDLTDIKLKREFCNYFKSLLSLYSQLHQLPKFFVKLLLALTECVKKDSAGDLINKGQIFPDVQKTLAACFQELSFGQTIELWKIFAEIYTTFGNLNQIFSSGKGAVFLFSQIFSVFLMHSKLIDPVTPANIYKQFGDLIQYTSNEIANNISVLLDQSEAAEYFKKSFLLLCFALGEVKVAYNCCSDVPYNESFTLKYSECAIDCSLLHSFFTEQHSDTLESFLSGKDKVLSLLVFKLVVQKVRGLLCKKNLSAEEKMNLKLSVSLIIQHAQDNSSNNAAWDFDLCSLEISNYGTAVWKVLLELIPLVIDDLNHKQLLAICECIQYIVFNSNEESNELSLSQIVLSSLQSEYLFESKSFQSAFTVSLWKFDDLLLHKKRSCDEMMTEEISLKDVLEKLSGTKSKWIKYSQTTPKDEDALNSLWNNLKMACDVFNQVLLNDSIVVPKINPELFNKIKLIKCLPLEYLLPGNQMQCVVGLFVLFFLVPESCSKTKALIIAEEISIHLVSIFEGVRSIWLLDFVSSGPFLYEVISTLGKLMELEKIVELQPWMKLLLDILVKLITRNSPTFSDMEFYFNRIEKAEKNDSRKNAVIVYSLFLILEKIAQLYHKAHISPELKETCHKMLNLSCRRFLKFLKLYKDSSNECILENLLSCFMTMIEIMTSSDCGVEPKIKNVCLEAIPSIVLFSKDKLSDESVGHEIYLKFITKMCSLSESIPSYLPDNFSQIAWEAVSVHLQNKNNASKSKLEVLSNSNHSCSKCENLTTFSPLCPFRIEELEAEALKSVCSVMTEECLKKSMEELINNLLEVNLSAFEALSFQKNLTVLRFFIESFVDKRNVFFPSQEISKVLFHFHFLVNELCDSHFYLCMVKIPVLQLLGFILKKRECGALRQSLVDSLHSCLGVKLNCLINDIPKFIEGFNAVWNVVYELLLYHPNIVLQARAAYLSYVSMLLKSLVKTGAHDIISTFDQETQFQMQLCAQNMDRLLTALSRYKTELSKLVPYLIADYIDSVQLVTLDAKIKAHLISGINRLFDLCSEDSIKTLAINLSHSCRDIFSNIVKNYKQYRFQGAI